MRLLEIDVGRVDIPVNDVGAVNVVNGLCELVEDPPNLIFVNPFVFSLGSGE